MSQQDLLLRISRAASPRLIVVGQQPKANDPMDPLSPDDPIWSGRRLMNMTQISAEEYRRVFQRINLIYEAEDHFGYNQTTRSSALEILGICSSGDCIVALGRTITRCFGFQTVAPLDYGMHPMDVRVYHLPHPSGLNRWYNDPTNTLAASDLLRRLYQSYSS